MVVIVARLLAKMNTAVMIGCHMPNLNLKSDNSGVKYITIKRDLFLR
jgi:hypothetical protein